MFLIYPTGVRIVVHTANLIYIDWNNKSQGLWMQDFPYKIGVAQESKPSPFENDLVEYLQALEVGCSFTLLVLVLRLVCSTGSYVHVCANSGKMMFF